MTCSICDSAEKVMKVLADTYIDHIRHNSPYESIPMCDKCFIRRNEVGRDQKEREKDRPKIIAYLKQQTKEVENEKRLDLWFDRQSDRGTKTKRFKRDTQKQENCF